MAGPKKPRKASTTKSARDRGGRWMASAEQQARQRAALVMRRDGASYEQIAADLGYATRAAAFGSVKAALTATLKEPADQLRALEDARLDRIHEIAMGIAAASRNQEMRLKATDRVRLISARRSTLLGLDMPTRLEHAGPGGSPLTVQVLPDLVPTMTGTDETADDADDDQT